MDTLAKQGADLQQEDLGTTYKVAKNNHKNRSQIKMHDFSWVYQWADQWWGSSFAMMLELSTK
jgi:hypothetical protein